MASKDMINHVRHFFNTTDENALAEVRAAASVKIEGDISIEEYLFGFNDEYNSKQLPRNIFWYIYLAINYGLDF